MASPDELQTLQKVWQQDPCWDIENTEGYEQHHDELQAFRVMMESKWSEDYKRRLEGLTDPAQMVERLLTYQDTGDYLAIQTMALVSIANSLQKIAGKKGIVYTRNASIE